jgi:hypothetical protein
MEDLLLQTRTNDILKFPDVSSRISPGDKGQFIPGNGPDVDGRQEEPGQTRAG